MESVSVKNTIDQPEQPMTCLGYTLDTIDMSRLGHKQKHKDGFCFLVGEAMAVKRKLFREHTWPHQDHILGLLLHKNLKSIEEEAPGETRPASAAGIIDVNDDKDEKTQLSSSGFAKNCINMSPTKTPSTIAPFIPSNVRTSESMGAVCASNASANVNLSLTAAVGRSRFERRLCARTRGQALWTTRLEC